jgi:hypothetical protein
MTTREPITMNIEPKDEIDADDVTDEDLDSVVGGGDVSTLGGGGC